MCLLRSRRRYAIEKACVMSHLHRRRAPSPAPRSIRARLPVMPPAKLGARVSAASTASQRPHRSFGSTQVSGTLPESWSKRDSLVCKDATLARLTIGGGNSIFRTDRTWSASGARASNASGPAPCATDQALHPSSQVLFANTCATSASPSSWHVHWSVANTTTATSAEGGDHSADS